MDPRLLVAAQTGDVGALDELQAEDPQFLERVSLGFCPESPLHVTVLAGHIEFVKELIRRKPELVKELSKDGFSPFHIAAINGNLPIVKEFLMSQLGYCLCSIKDSSGERTALHCAVIKGRVNVVSEVLSASPDSVREVTSWGETVLHLAVKNNQFEAFKTVMEKNIGIEEILNAKDRDGNTVLHLAISKRQHRIIELLLDRETVGKLEVNAKNAMNLTPMDILDVLLQSSCEWSDIQTGEILLRVGALRTQDIHTLPHPNIPKPITSPVPPAHNNIQTTKPITSPVPPAHNNIQTTKPITSPVPPAHNNIQTSSNAPTKEPFVARTISFLKDYYNELFREIEESPIETQNSLMVVAVLIATVTYQGALYPPGGVWQDHKHTISPDDAYSTLKKKYMIHDAGKAVMTYEPFCYVLFMVLNTVGFVTSLIIISLLTSRFPLKAWLRLAVVSMGTAFGCGFCFIATFANCVKVIFLLIFCAAVVSWKYWWLEKWAVVKERRRVSKGLENQQLSVMQRVIQFIASRSGSVAPSNTA